MKFIHSATDDFSHKNNRQLLWSLTPQDLHVVLRKPICLVDKNIIHTKLDITVCLGCLGLIMALSLYISDVFTRNRHKTAPET